MKTDTKMELELSRRYFQNGCNGVIHYGELYVCNTIELPWKDNHRRESCIPEGRYELKKRYSPKFKSHLIVKDVPGRSLVLIHPANDALTELKGCIAPVCKLTGEGKGLMSKNALIRLLAVVNAGIRKGPVFLTIKPFTL